jgi:hypothetical protein
MSPVRSWVPTVTVRADMGTTSDELHRLSAHVLGRRRFEVSGRFGLRSSPGGVATPAFGPEPEVLRTDGMALIREVGSRSTSLSLEGATLAGLAEFAGADLGSEFSAGPATVPLGDVDRPLDLDPGELAGLVAWFELGWRVLDPCVAQLAGTTTTLQLWPEHFDAGTTVDLGPVSVNLGFSAGDAFADEPYLYVGPWDERRPGDPAYWNAPFGAFATRSQAGEAEACEAFLRTGLERLMKA